MHHGITAFSYDRKTEASLLSHAADLDQLLSDRYPDECLADDFHQRYLTRGQPCVARPTRTASAASANVWRVATVPYQHFEAPGLARPARVLARFTSRRANAERQFGAPSAGAGWEDA